MVRLGIAAAIVVGLGQAYGSHPQGLRAGDIGAPEIANMKGMLRGDAERIKGPFEDPRMWFGNADFVGKGERFQGVEQFNAFQ